MCANVTRVTQQMLIMVPFAGQFVMKDVSMVTALRLTNAPVIWGTPNMLVMAVYVCLPVSENVSMADVRHLIHVYVILASLRTQNININVYRYARKYA
jgi:hypothetical protein